MSKRYPQKQTLIDMLIDDDLADWHSKEDKDAYFAHLLRTGMVGYQDLFLDQLIDECVSRGLLEDENE